MDAARPPLADSLTATRATPLRQMVLGALLAEAILRTLNFEFSSRWLNELASELTYLVLSTTVVLLAGWCLLRWSPRFRAQSAKWHFRAGVLGAFALIPVELVALTQLAPPPAAHAPRTADCSLQVHYDEYRLARDIVVSALEPAKHDRGLALQIVYRLPKSTRAEFKGKTFTLRAPGAGDALQGRVTGVERMGADDSGYVRSFMDTVPDTVTAGPGGMASYVVTLVAPDPLPERIDVDLPRMLIDGGEYAPGVFSYRTFEPHTAYQLCR